MFWDKCVDVQNFSAGEYAWTSFDKPASKVVIRNTIEIMKSIKKNERIHPTQKPVSLYKWLLKNYAKQGDKILGTHLGSGSIAIACHYMGFNLTACELDKEYFDNAMKRIEEQTRQLTLL